MNNKYSIFSSSFQTKKLRYGCAGCPLTRRQFFKLGCAASAGLACGLATSVPAIGAAAKRLRLRVIYSLHGPKQTGPDWPNKGFDFEPVMRRFNNMLAQKFPEMEFIPSMANGPEQAQKLVDADKAAPVDGYVVFQMNCWNRVVQTVAATGKPLLYVDFQYAGSGGFLAYTAAFLRQQAPNVGFVASSRTDDLLAAVRCFNLLSKGGTASDFAAATAQIRRERTPKPGSMAVKKDAVQTLPIAECIKRLGESKILAVRGTQAGPAEPMFGIPVVHVPFAELNEAWKNADQDEAQVIALKWEKGASRIAGVDWSTLVNCAAMYLAEKAVMKKHGANAITINCLGGFYGGHIHAYPCLGFHQLNNEGLVGGCECDVRSTATMLAFSILTKGRPGYISDPVIDTSKRQIIYAHCVASNRVFGPDCKPNPYQILTHSEDRQGASVRSIMPLGYMTTTLEVQPGRKEILMHQGKAVANDPDDRACRTKLCVEPVGDIEKLFTFWDQWGWHRVTFYGDIKEPVMALADAMGWKVIMEA